MTKHVTQCSETCREGRKGEEALPVLGLQRWKKKTSWKYLPMPSYKALVIKTKRAIKAIQGNQVYCQSLLLVSKWRNHNIRQINATITGQTKKQRSIMSRARDFQDTLTQTSFAKLHIWTWVKWIWTAFFHVSPSTLLREFTWRVILCPLCTDFSHSAA